MKNDSMPRGSGSFLDENIFIWGVGRGGGFGKNYSCMRKKSRTKKTTGTFLVPCLFSVCKSLIIMLYNVYVLNYLILLSSVSSLPTEKLFILFCVKVVIDAYSVFQDYLFPTWTFWTRHFSNVHYPTYFFLPP